MMIFKIMFLFLNFVFVSVYFVCKTFFFLSATDEAPNVGDIFLHLAPYLKLYATYFRNYIAADALQKKLNSVF